MRNYSVNVQKVPSILLNIQSLVSMHPCWNPHPQYAIIPTGIGDILNVRHIDQLKDIQQDDIDLQHKPNTITNDNYSNSYPIQDGLLMHHELDMKPVLCVPKGQIRHDIKKIYHDTQVNHTHFGRDKTHHKI
ncbi:unnamed protein product [Rotaria magnacalcarata]|uniref:Uncharacterized protein n=2 Tax=Rotaria magnacalcarata TaxID=392030 RepID=A0A816D089_9BILA|nr:unnamed protein product [Rotaria magnacalcarata]